MATINKPTVEVTPVLDSAVNNVLNHIYDFLKRDKLESKSRENDNSKNLLDSIRNSARENSAAQRAVRNALNGAAAENRDNAHRTLLRSLASEKRSRAVNNAILGSQNKSYNLTSKFLDTFKSGMDKLAGLVKEGFSDAVSKYDDFSKEMRKQRISYRDKVAAQDRAGEAFMYASGKFNTPKEVITDFLQSIYRLPEFRSLSTEQIALMSEIQRNTGMESEKLLKLFIRQGSGNLDTLKTIALRTVDRSSAEAFTIAAEELASNQSFAPAIMAAGGADNILNDTLTNIRDLAAATGNAFNDKAMAELVSSSTKIDAGLLEQVSNENVHNLLAALGSSSFDGGKQLGDAFRSIEDRFKNLSEAERQKQAMAAAEQIRVLASQGQINENILDGLSQFYTQLYKGEFKSGQVESDESLQSRVSENTSEGWVKHGMQYAVDWLNSATGGLISNISVAKDVAFGDSVSTNEILSSGFEFLKDILTLIAARMMLPGAGGLAGLAGLGTTLGTSLAALGPALATAGAAALAIGGVGAAIYTISDKWKKQENADKAKSDVIKNRKEIEEYRQLLAAAKDKKNPELEKFYQGKLDEALSKQPALIEAKRKADEEDMSKQQKLEREWLENTYNPKMDELKSEQARQKALGVDTSKIDKEIERLNKLKDQFFETSNSFIGSFDFLAADADALERRLWIKERLSEIGDWFLDGWSAFGKSAKMKLSEAGNWIKDKLSAVGDWFSDKLKPVTDWISNFITNLLNKVPDVRSFLDSVSDWLHFKWLPDPIKSFLGIDSAPDNSEGKSQSKSLSNIRDAVSNISNHLNKSSAENSSAQMQRILRIMPNSMSRITPLSQPNQIATFASGGIVDGLTPAIVGEAGKEAILPLSRPNDLASVISQLSSDEQLKILNAIGNDSSLNSTFIKSQLRSALPSSVNIDELYQEIEKLKTRNSSSNQSDNTTANSSDDLKEVIVSLTAIIKYLKDMASSLGNKRSPQAVARFSTGSFN